MWWSMRDRSTKYDLHLAGMKGPITMTLRNPKLGAAFAAALIASLFAIAPAGAQATCGGLVPTIESNAAEIVGTTGNDVILAGPGNNMIRGIAGDDVICGGDGDDEIIGGLGADIIFAGNGDDFVKGGSGADDIFGGPGDDELRGALGNDEIHGEEGNDLVK